MLLVPTMRITLPGPSNVVHFSRYPYTGVQERSPARRTVNGTTAATGFHRSSQA
jgi:hypothetical protein